MSMNVQLHVCNNQPKDTDNTYWSKTCFEIDSWKLGILEKITEKAKPITRRVCIDWPHFECREAKDIDAECTWLVTCGDLKSLKFHEDDWHPARIMKSMAMSAYLNAYPDDWPVIVHYV